MNKICGYSCEHNKGGVCQITSCDKKIIMTTTTEPQILTRWQDPTIEDLKKEIDKLTAESTKWEERTYCWQDRAENLQIVLDKIKEYCNNRLQYYNEMRSDYMREFDGYAENDNENILELLNILKGDNK